MPVEAANQAGDRRGALPLNQVIIGDCLSVMKGLPAESVDLIFADPPYNLQLAGELHRPDQSRVAGVEEAWDKFADFAAYDRFTLDWLSAAKRILKPDGSIWVVGSYHNIFRVGTALQNLGFWILNDVIWRKNNPMPNFRGRRFCNAHETLLWCARDREARYRFNYDAMKSLNEDRQMRSDWLLPICSGQERLKDGKGQKAHPTQKPESLLHRVILASTRPGDVVLDPFFGTGTTGAAARRMGRHFIGIERDSQYAALARRRVEKIAWPEAPDLFAPATRREAARIPFGWLLERGYLQVGSFLFSPDRQWIAQIRADASLVTGHYQGSIHKVGAAVQGLSACNGWQFWQVEEGGKLIALDSLRQRLREEMAESE